MVLDSIAGVVRGGYKVILCPFHADSNPSCSVKLNAPYQGFYKCWSCNAKGSYKQLCEKLGISEDGITPRAEDYEHLFKVEEALHDEEDSDDFTLYPLTDRNAKRIGIQDGWRTFPVNFLRDTVKASVLMTSYGTYMLYLPVLISGEEVGYIKARLAPSKGKPSYLNKKGVWAKTKGLFPFDQSMAIARDTMIIVEGPRDAMRLLDMGLPAVSILGTNNWTQQKARLLDKAGITKLVLCLDGDVAGKAGTDNIIKVSEGHFQIKDMGLYDIEGEYDPGNMPEILQRRLKKLYERTVC
jgi:Toprim domain/CHC2 zinc finger